MDLAVPCPTEPPGGPDGEDLDGVRAFRRAGQIPAAHVALQLLGMCPAEASRPGL